MRLRHERGLVLIGLAGSMDVVNLSLSLSLLEKLHFGALKRLEQLAGTRRTLEHQSAEPESQKRKLRKRDE